MIYFLLLTAFTVSIDSFVCGFSLACSVKRKAPIVCIIAITVYIMCLFTNYLAVFFADKLTEKTASLGGIILILIGLYNLFKKDEQTLIKGNLSQYFIAGFAVGLDGALANLSLSIMGINAFYVPIVIAVMHAILIALGISLSNFRFAKKLSKIKYFAPLLLIALGTYKLSGFFIL